MDSLRHQQEVCDKILSYLIANPNQEYDEKRLQNGLYPDIAREFLKHLIDGINISTINPKIVSYHNYNDGGIKCNAFTKQFLGQGGFTGAMTLYQFNGLDEIEQAEAIRNAIYFPYFAFLTKSY